MRDWKIEINADITITEVRAENARDAVDKVLETVSIAQGFLKKAKLTVLKVKATEI